MTMGTSAAEREVRLPRKQLPHEWWYYSGHLFSGQRHIAFHFAFFRRPRSLRSHPIPHASPHSRNDHVTTDQ